VSKNKPGYLVPNLNKIMIQAKQNMFSLNNNPDINLEGLDLSKKLVNMAAMIVHSLGNRILDRWS